MISFPSPSPASLLVSGCNSLLLGFHEGEDTHLSSLHKIDSLQSFRSIFHLNKSLAYSESFLSQFFGFINTELERRSGTAKASESEGIPASGEITGFSVEYGVPKQEREKVSRELVDGVMVKAESETSVYFRNLRRNLVECG